MANSVASLCLRRQTTGGGIGRVSSQRATTWSPAAHTRVRDLIDGRRRQAARPRTLKSRHGFLENLVEQIAEGQRIEGERLVGLRGLRPSEAIGPEIPEWIA